MLVRGGRLGSHRTVSAAATIGPATWPTDRHGLVERLREARRRLDLPSRARVVAWNGEASVAPLGQGDAVIFAVQNRPVQSARGFAKVNVRHGVSELRSGQRYTLGIIFHDAKS